MTSPPFSAAQPQISRISRISSDGPSGTKSIFRSLARFPKSGGAANFTECLRRRNSKANASNGWTSPVVPYVARTIFKGRRRLISDTPWGYIGDLSGTKTRAIGVFPRNIIIRALVHPYKEQPSIPKRTYVISNHAFKSPTVLR